MAKRDMKADKNTGLPSVRCARRYLTGLAAALILSTAGNVSSADMVRFPSQGGFVTDEAGIISAGTETGLDNFISAVEKQTSAEISVVTVRTTAPLSIEEYAVRLFERWGIGKKGKDNGVLLLVASDDRRVRIETGYGLEGAITDLYGKQIIDKLVVPHFKKGDYDAGITAAVATIAKLTADEYGVKLDIPKETAALSANYASRGWSSPLSGLLTLILFILIFGFRFGTLFFFMGSGRGGYWSGGSSGSFGGGFGGFGGGMSGGGGASGSW